MADRARVLEDALTLPVADRASVAHELLRSLEGEDADVAAAWTDEIGRRIDEVEAGTAELHAEYGARPPWSSPDTVDSQPMQLTG